MNIDDEDNLQIKCWISLLIIFIVIIGITITYIINLYT